MSVSPEYLRERIVRLKTSNGTTAGVGFRVLEGGQLITCAHVLARVGELVAEDVEGKAAAIEVLEVDLARDIGLFRASLSTKPIPVEQSSFNPQYWTSMGFPYGAEGIGGPLSASGAIGGRTSVNAEVGRERSTLAVLALLGGDIRPGMSGAPVISPDSGALIGIISQDFFLPNDAPTVHGFAIPIELLQRSPMSSDLIGNAIEVTPRHGPRPNRGGAAYAVEMITQRALTRMDREAGEGKAFRVDRTRINELGSELINFSGLTIRS